MKSAELDKEWHVGEYAEDVYAYLRKREQRLLPYHHQSPQLAYRRALVDYLGQICDRMKFCTRTKHLALYYLDIFMDHHNIGIQHLQLVTIGCIIVAVKVDEKDSLIPATSIFSHFLYNKYHLKELIEMEVSIMEFLKWELLIPTAAVFAENYLLHSICPSDIQAKSQLQCIEQAKSRLLQHVSYFLELSIQDYTFRDFPPSVVAASCIAISRLCLHLIPMWSTHLQDRTHYSIEDIGPCLAKMINFIHDEPPLKHLSPMKDDFKEERRRKLRKFENGS